MDREATAGLDDQMLRGRGLRARVRGVGQDNLLVVRATIGVLLLVGSFPVLVTTVVGGRWDDDPSFGLVLVGLVVIGAGVAWSALHQAGTGGGLRAFAVTNRLAWVEGPATAARADLVVHQGVRTRGTAWREVGDRLGADTSEGQPRAYLRAELPTDGPAQSGLTTDLRADLRDWAGPYELAVGDGELVVLATRPLEAELPGRVQDGLALLERVVAQVCPASAGETAVARPTVEGPRGVRPARVVLALLAALLVLPTLLAVVLSLLAEELRGNELRTGLVLTGFVVVTSVVMGGLTLWASSVRRRGRRPGDGS